MSFGLPVNYAADLAAQSLVSADFNGDGRLDLAALDSANNTVSVLVGNGDGTFQPARTSAGINARAIMPADLNGDGKSDLVALPQPGSRVLSLLFANDDGTFQPPQTMTLSEQIAPLNPELGPLMQYPVAVAIGDFNEDGNVDLVAGGQTNYWITFSDERTRLFADDYANVLLGNGDGTFLHAAAKPIPGGIFSIARDFNNDGWLDLVNNHGVLPGNGDGTFQDLVSSSVSVAYVTNPVGDFNGDGNLDVLGDGVQTGPILQLGNGDGTFQLGQYLDLNSDEHYSVVGDVNADGKLDIVVIQSAGEHELDEDGFPSYYPTGSTRSARVLLGHGDGTFAPVVSEFGTVQRISAYRSPVLADFDGDGLADLAAVEHSLYADGDDPNNGYRGVHVMLNDGIWMLPPPPPPTIHIGDVTVTEGNTGTRATTFSVTLSAAYSQQVTVAYSTVNGSAAAGSDYQAVTDTLTFAPGETTKTITVLVYGDRFAEPSETFFVNLSGATNASIADGEGVGTILDDEPRISIGDVTKKEGNGKKSTLFTFTVTLSAAYDQAVTMSFQTANGSATTSDNDYVAKTGTLTFAPGETTKTITIEVKGDKKKEANETFYLDLFNLSSNALFTKNRGLGTILNDD